MADACNHAYRYGGAPAAKAAGHAAACGKGAGRSSPYNNVGDRLYSQVHVCNHARCAANDPHYNVKPPTPAKKFLLAKSRHRVYGGPPSPDEKAGDQQRSGGIAAAEAKAAKNSKPGGRKNSADHDQNELSSSLHALANPRLQAPQGDSGRRHEVARHADIPFSKGQGRNKDQDRKLSALAHSVLQHSKAWDPPVKDKKVHSPGPTRNLTTTIPKTPRFAAPTIAALGKTARPNPPSSHQANPSSRPNAVTNSKRGEAQEKRPQKPIHANGSSFALAPSTPAAVDQHDTHNGKNSTSPQSSITSISITQIISTSNRDYEDGEDEVENRSQEEQHHSRAEDQNEASFPSPVTSVGSNCDDDIISSFRETEVTVEGDDLDPPVKLHRSSVDVSFVPRAVETPSTPSQKESRDPSDSLRTSTSTPLSLKSKLSTADEQDEEETSAAAPSSPTASVASSSSSSSSSKSSSTATSPASSSSQSSDDVQPPPETAAPFVTSAPTASTSLRSMTGSGKIHSNAETSTPRSSVSPKPHSPVEAVKAKGAVDDSSKSPSKSSVSPKLHSPTLISSSSTSALEAVKAKRAVDGSSKSPSKSASPSPARKPARTQSCGSPSGSAASSSQLARAFIANLHASSVARKAGGTKGVRSIELRGGKARSYSKTTVTSWNVTTTTIEESSQPNSENSPQQQPKASPTPFLARAGSTPVGSKSSWQSRTKENSRANRGTNARNADFKQRSKVGNGAELRFARRAKTTTTAMFDELLAESGRASLKHGEVAERRLSEEWMTNHALEGVVKKIADKDRRVKVLVHAFETLASALPDADVAQDGDENNVNVDTQLEYDIISAAPIAA